MGHKTVGNTLAEWNDNTPLIFELKEEFGPSDIRHVVTIRIDLSELRQSYTDFFLASVKDILIEWRKTLSLTTIETYSRNFKYLLSKIQNIAIFEEKINTVDDLFLLSISAVKDQLKDTQLSCLRRAFIAAPYSPLWAQGLQVKDFPSAKQKKGCYGQQIDRILAKTLSRDVCVYILSKCEQAYELGQIDIGHFSFANLAFSVFCRPQSYRQIRLNDLVFDTKSGTFFLYITPAKTHIHNPEKICYRINEPVGLLLQKQRQHVIQKYGHLVDPQDSGKLCLFPARHLHNNDSAWVHSYANQNFGMLENSNRFDGAYPREIQREILGEVGTLGANVLRHTVGTQLAQIGASAKTIQAVLKHATDNICNAYVDIAFHGLIDVLSDAMKPAFEKHIPIFNRFRSKLDPIEPEQAIRSENFSSGRIELTGECGKNIQCEYAPISCYGCNRFIPCWDADHSINLDIVQQEIDECDRRGKPFQHLVERARTAKYQIIIIMNAVDRYRENIASGLSP